MENKITPCGNLITRTIAMPKDINYMGDIFGGWLVSQMDLAAGILSRSNTKCKNCYSVYRLTFFYKACQNW